jgi:DHA1 family bicyclomycin/chloramphenicol resistance-like MFS transporter
MFGSVAVLLCSFGSNEAMPSASLSKREFIALLACLTMVEAIAGDIMLPALPDIGDALSVQNPNDRSLVLMAFGIGFGLPQVVFGPISDRFGRRVPILVGMVFYVACSLASPLAPSFAVLLGVRALQGVAAAAVKVAVTAAVRDRYSGTEMAEVTSLMMSIFLLVPVVMPSVGQIILLVAPWQMIFVAMGILALAIGIWAWVRFRETLPREARRPLSFDAVADGFALVVGNRRAFFYGASGIFFLGAVLGMIFTSQQIYVGIFGWGPYYALAMMAMGGSASLCSLVVARVLRRLGLRRTAHAAATSLAALAFGGALIALTVGLPSWAYLLLACLFAAPLVSGFASGGALSMEPLGEVAGTAAAVFGLLATVIGTGFSYLIQQAFNETVVPTLVGMGIMGLFALASFAIAEKGRLFSRDPASLPLTDPAAAF